MTKKIELDEVELNKMAEAATLAYMVERMTGVDELTAVGNIAKKITQSLFDNIARVAEERGGK